MSTVIPNVLANASFVPIPRGKKIPACAWSDVRLSAADAQARLDGNNLAIRVGRDSGGIVDADLDCGEALSLADLYLPPTGAIFGRQSKQRSWLIS